jgi:hypothetical protein
VTASVKQKKEPAGTVTLLAGEKPGVVRPEPDVSVVLDCAIVVGEEHVLDEL